MRQFAFSLARVADWRKAQVQIEEAALERIQAELRVLEARLSEIRAAARQSKQTLLNQASMLGVDLTALDHFEKASVAECAKLAEGAATLRDRISAQIAVVIGRRRDVRLLENLRESRLEAWKAGLAREIDQEAAELYLAKRTASLR